MALKNHKLIDVDNIHIAYNWTYANAAARTGATGFLSSAVGKFARQLDNNSIWMLVGYSPVVWKFIGGGSSQNIQNNYSASTNPTVTDDSAAGYQVGSSWINTLTGEEFVLVDSTVGAAQWKSTTSRVPTSHGSTHTNGTDNVPDLVGDSGSGGTHGLAPAPAAGDAAAGKYLKASGVWEVPVAGAITRHIVTGVLFPITTSSTSDVLATDMTVTPGAGTYLCLFSAAAGINKNSELVYVSFYANNLQVSDSERRSGGQANNLSVFALMHIITVTAGQAIETRWRISNNAGGGVGTMYRRTMILLKVA